MNDLKVLLLEQQSWICNVVNTKEWSLQIQKGGSATNGATPSRYYSKWCRIYSSFWFLVEFCFRRTEPGLLGEWGLILIYSHPRRKKLARLYPSVNCRMSSEAFILLCLVIWTVLAAGLSSLTFYIEMSQKPNWASRPRKTHPHY